jgi:hypothetical protein
MRDVHKCGRAGDKLVPTGKAACVMVIMTVEEDSVRYGEFLLGEDRRGFVLWCGEPWDGEKTFRAGCIREFCPEGRLARDA